MIRLVGSGASVEIDFSGKAARSDRAPVPRKNCHTASFAALTGRAFTIFRAGLALNTVGSLVKGLMPLRALVAGFLITTNLAKPGKKTRHSSSIPGSQRMPVTRGRS